MRYLENWAKHISTLPEAITFDPTVGFLIYLVLWKLDIQKFPGTLKAAQYNFRKAFKYVSEVESRKR